MKQAWLNITNRSELITVTIRCADFQFHATLKNKL